MSARTNFTVRFAHDEIEKIKRAALAQGVSVSDYLRSAALGAKPAQGHDEKLQNKLLDLLNSIEAVAEKDKQDRLETLALLSKAGNGFNNILARMQAAAQKI